MDWWQMLLIFLVFMAVGLGMGHVFTKQMLKNGMLERKQDMETLGRKPLSPKSAVRDYA